MKGDTVYVNQYFRASLSGRQKESACAETVAVRKGKESLEI